MEYTPRALPAWHIRTLESGYSWQVPGLRQPTADCNAKSCRRPPPLDALVFYSHSDSRASDSRGSSLSATCTTHAAHLFWHAICFASEISFLFSARCCNIYISRLCHDASPSVRLSVRLSVTKVHLSIIANLGFKFGSHFTAHWPPYCWRAPCCLRANHLAPC